MLALVAPAAVRPDTLVVPLREVVVTATRAPEPWLRAPTALTVLRRDAFADGRGISLKDALAGVPGVFVQSRAGAQDVRVTIRGFGARGNGDRSNAGNMRGIRVLTDGIPVTEPDGRTALDLVDLGSAERIEVVRSNASALYGNASGGVVNLRSDLDFDQPYLEVRQKAGSFGYHREQLVSGFALGPARAGLSLVNSTFEGWRAHSMSTTSQAQFRLSAPLDGRTRLGMLLDAVSDLNRFPGPLTQAQLDADPRQASPRYVAQDERRRNRVGRVGLTLDRAFDAARDLSLALFLEPKVLQRSERRRFRDFTRYHTGGSALYRQQVSVGPGWEASFTAGGDEAWQDGSILFYDLGPGSTRGEDLVANKREGANSAGGFVESELRWRKRGSARLALRYDALWYLSEDRIEPELNAQKTFRRFTPKGTLSWQAGDHTVYAALGGGVEAPAFNEIDPPPGIPPTSLNPFLEATHSTTWETGARGQLPVDARLGVLRYDAALYWIEVRNDLVPYDGGAYFFTAGATRRRGLELGLDWLPVERVLLEGAFTWSHNRYVDYRYTDENALPQDAAGHEVAGLPAKVFHGTARLGPWSGCSAELMMEAVDGYFADDRNSARTVPYTVLDATVAYGRSLGPATLRAYVAGHNLADERYVASVFINGVNAEYFEPGLPRSWSAGLALRWQ